MLHVQTEDGITSVWIRDASLDACAQLAVLASLSTELAAAGTRLAALTINGRAIYRSQAERDAPRPNTPPGKEGD
jgi:hypothetical protein